MEKKLITKTKINIGYSLLYKIVSIIVPLITSPYLSRILGPEKIGEYNYIASIAFYFFYFAMLGVNDYGNREIARARDSKEKLSETFWQIFYIQFFLTLISLFFYILVVIFFLTELKFIGILTGLYVLSAAIDINWLLYGCEKIKYCSIIFSLQKIFVFLGIFIFVRNQNDLWKYVLIINGNLIIFTSLFWRVVLTETFFQKPNFKIIVKHLKPDLLLFLPIIASSIFSQMDKIMLGGYKAKLDVGFYSLSENIINIFLSLGVAVNSVMLPKIASLIEHGNRESGFEYLYKTTFFMNAINIGIIFGTFSISQYLIPWYLGDSYIESAYLLNILVPSVFLNSFTGIIRSQYLIPNRKDSIYVISIISGAILNLMLNFFMIPQYGARGAAVTTIIAHGVVLLIQCFFTKNLINYYKIIKEIVPFILFGLIMFFIVKLIPLASITIITLMIKTIVGFVIYVGLSLILYIILNKRRKKVQ